MTRTPILKPTPDECETCGTSVGRLTRFKVAGPWECPTCYMYRRNHGGLPRPDDLIVKASKRHAAKSEAKDADREARLGILSRPSENDRQKIMGK